MTSLRESEPVGMGWSMLAGFTAMILVSWSMLTGLVLKGWLLIGLMLLVGAAIPFALVRDNDDKRVASTLTPLLGLLPAMMASEMLAHLLLGACLYD